MSFANGANLLPIHAHQQEIIQALKQHQVLIIAGATGSGKTTQLPQFCLQTGRVKRCLGITQPRRIAALSLARRLAEETGSSLGEKVGCKIRFHEQLSKKTQLKVMTDGILLNELQQDPLLRSYDTLIIDEAHERSLNIDLILGFLKPLLKKRADLNLLVTSATIDTEKFARYFVDARILEIEGRSYPVEIRYQPTEEALSLAEHSQQALAKLLEESSQGDTLIFMPSEADIHETCRLISGAWPHLEVLPLFAQLNQQKQQLIFTPSTRRRVIVSTNIAETSLTIPSIRYVIDSGLARIGRYSSSNTTFSLHVEPISQSSANQRAGRCGRVQDGVCIRLFSQEDYERRAPFLQPEIQRSNLAAVVLQMLNLELQPRDFELIDNPSRAAYSDGLRRLRELRAIEKIATAADYRLNQRGKQLLKFPLDPSLATVILQAQEENVVSFILCLVSILGIYDPRERPLEQAADADKMHKRFQDLNFARRIFPQSVLAMLPQLAPKPEQPLGSRKKSDEQESPLSDILALLVLWFYVENTRQKMSKSQWRKLCQREFLSFNRLREWQETYKQLQRICEKMKIPLDDYQGENLENALYRSLAAGFLSHLGQKQVEEEEKAQKTFSKKKKNSVNTSKNNYLFAYQRQARIHPSSSYFHAPPSWVIALDLVETSAVYARNVFPVNPKMLISLAGDLCEHQLHSPRWSAKRDRVVALEKVRLFGFILDNKKLVPYDIAQPQEAQNIFIRNALLVADFSERDLQRFSFITENIKKVEEAKKLEERQRHRGLALGEEGLYQFYQQLFHNQETTVNNLQSLALLLKQKKVEDFSITEEFLFVQAPTENFYQLYPEQLKIGEQSYQLEYHFTPGEDKDGVSLKIPVEQCPPLKSVSTPLFIPGYLKEGLHALLQSLPLRQKRLLSPLAQSEEKILPRLKAEIERQQIVEDAALAKLLSRLLSDILDVVVPLKMWDFSALPQHLQLRLQLLNTQKKTLAAARSLEVLKKKYLLSPSDEEEKSLREQWQAESLDNWPVHFNKSIPQRFVLKTGLLFPALVPTDLAKLCLKTAKKESIVYKRGQESRLTAQHCQHDPLLNILAVNEIRLNHAYQFPSIKLEFFYDQELAACLHPLGCAWLLAFQHQRLLSDLQKSFTFNSLTFPPQLWRGREAAERRCFIFSLVQVLSCSVWSHEEFLQEHEKISAQLYENMQKWFSVWQKIVQEAWQYRLFFEKSLRSSPQRLWLSELDQRYAELLDVQLFSFVDIKSSHYIERLPCYLQGLRKRLERGLNNPLKDRQKAETLVNITQRYEQEYARYPANLRHINAIRSSLWQLEELHLAIFAPELRQKQALSEKKLLALFNEILSN